MTSIFLRSLIFNVLFYLVLVVLCIIALPALLLPRGALMALEVAWANTSLFLMRVICNIRIEFRGIEKIPSGPLVVASKHQSFWETFALVRFFEHPLFILKRELMMIPVFGWYLKKVGMISVERGGGPRSLIKTLKRAAAEVKLGRQLVIFPEGTRTAPGAPPNYKAGVAQIYAESGVPCLPIALNSGLFWPRRTFMRYPGTLVVEFLDPLPPGLPRDEFMARLRDQIETATTRIVEAGRAEQAKLFGGVPNAAKG
ncbi:MULTISPECIES: lysophospholipid acyltransferase family protein [Bradyrhizobium]|uniref:Lysophospholipid acyltransferase family protein n=1 Tax=Bradyrhizobium brasilense TaxID=1419277 RepID=A0ABY8JMX3_9BRAD|nr:MULTISPECIES: lysophospholipid acyltransferase family protein [Bradyrhizobium]MCP1912291.1 1-acyl-sn-glycerol-3-phosphate acyltransferase [Bradyrhizobium elkanii]KRQ01357.1 acyl-phosphate glycerol 3-phosphate acyltransferase [Bradyrhizobium pachyrhizi]MCC8944123.1 1-acyl-sn-glycerol-3-phosphate acyltransferase [Bradyrhizobium brasilense]MCP1829905.1 1-acyl-sn-glycerol-3-phosphate acyltransferase [Bradyrhizobium sp. USDA 4545]MCP1848551.1 1-acyl-sn-glycerol-3-phosphate acyltransferase [Brady